MYKLNRKQTSIIFKARTKMLDIKNNFRNKYADLICRACGLKDETQEHVMNECQEIHKNNSGTVSLEDIFQQDPKKLAKTLEKIIRIVTQLCQSGMQINTA